MEQVYKYFAFISYNSHDTAWGKRIQRKLEGYRMPATLCSERGWKRNPIKPVFFAPTDIQPGGLSAELQEKLRASQNLIVVCSPHSARSEWVAKEIAYFHSLGRTNRIYFFIVEGTPHSGNPATECFNPIVDTLGIPEILGANVHERIYKSPWLNRERAYVQLVTKLLGVEFDSIWQRHRRMLRRKIMAWCVGLLVVLAALIGVWMANRPVDVEVVLNETTVHNENLPPLQNAVLTVQLDNETKTDTVRSLDDKGLFANIPHRAIGKKVRLRFSSPDWLPVDTTLVLTEQITIHIARDPNPYGHFQFRLWSISKGQGLGNVRVNIAGHTAVSDAQGFVRMVLPLKDQRKAYHVECPLSLETDTLFVPTSESTALVVND